MKKPKFTEEPNVAQKNKRAEESVPVRVFVGGGQEYYGPTAIRDAQISRLVPQILYTLAPEIEIVTGGMPGIADNFAGVWEGACLDVVSTEYYQQYIARDKRTSRKVMMTRGDQKHRRLEVTQLEGIKCAFFIQGGKYSTHEIKLFQERGIPIVTLYGGGGASGGGQPYEGWTYEPEKHVLTSIVASTNPDVPPDLIAAELVHQIMLKISEHLSAFRIEQGEPKKSKKMDLAASMCGIPEDEEVEEEFPKPPTPHLRDLGEVGQKEEDRIVALEQGEEDEELCGLLCAPPGMTASQARKFNAGFRNMSSQEQMAVIGGMVQQARDRGIPVTEIKAATNMADLPGPTKVLFSFDIESRGDNLIEHGILSVGVCVGLVEYPFTILHKERIDLKPLQYLDQSEIDAVPGVMKRHAHVLDEYRHIDRSEVDTLIEAAMERSNVKTQDFEQRCLDEFWHNEEKFPGNKAKLAVMLANPVDAMEGIRAFRAILDKWDDGIKFKAFIVSDNVVFDAGWINYYLYKAGCNDLSHNASGGYRRIFDTVDYRRGVCHMDHADKWLNERGIIERFGIDVDPGKHTHMPEDDAEYIYNFYVRLMTTASKHPITIPKPKAVDPRNIEIEEETTKIAFVFDVECRGDDAKRNGIISIGYTVGLLDSIEILEKGRIGLKPLTYMEQEDLKQLGPGDDWTVYLRVQGFEQRCLEQAWNEEKTPGITEKLKKMQAGAVDAIEGIKAFRAILDKWDDRSQGHQVVIISDNVTYDCRMINHYLSQAGLPSLNYDSTQTSYRPNIDTESYARGVERMDYSSIWTSDADIIAKHALNVSKDQQTHMPEDDAEYIYRMHVGLMLKVSQEKV